MLSSAEALAARLVARHETVAVAETSSGGLVSASLLAVPGASAFYMGGVVTYTGRAREALLGVTEADMAGIRSASEPYALLLARTVRARLGTTWGVSETGAAGPTGNRYGDPAGHTCIAVAGPGGEAARTLRTGHGRRGDNMAAFTAALIEMFEGVVGNG